MDIDISYLERAAVHDQGVRLGLCIIYARFEGGDFDWDKREFVRKVG